MGDSNYGDFSHSRASRGVEDTVYELTEEQRAVCGVAVELELPARGYGGVECIADERVEAQVTLDQRGGDC